jgi:hypothetical protein
MSMSKSAENDLLRLTPGYCLPAAGHRLFDVFRRGLQTMPEYFVESFDNGIGALNHVWGNPNIDTSKSGQVTVSGDGGFMQRPWGASTGFGYGTYEVVASISGNTAGPAALLWPGDDVWPGQEFDILEVINGTPYGAVHWRGSNGGDGYQSVYFNGVDESKVHTYTLDWEPGKITYYVDGKWMGEVDDNVGRDYDNGGTNQVFGLQNKGWATSMTVYEVSYSSDGSGGGGDSGSNSGSSTPSSSDNSWSPEPEASSGGDDGWQSSTKEPWWDAWEAAWDANAYAGKGDAWMGKFWSEVAQGNYDYSFA